MKLAHGTFTSRGRNDQLDLTPIAVKKVAHGPARKATGFGFDPSTLNPRTAINAPPLTTERDLGHGTIEFSWRSSMKKVLPQIVAHVEKPSDN